MTSFGVPQIGRKIQGQASLPTAQLMGTTSDTAAGRMPDVTPEFRKSVCGHAPAAPFAARNEARPAWSAATMPASVGAVEKPRRCEPVTPAPGPSPRQAGQPLGRLGVLQVICWQLALIAVALVLVEQSRTTVSIAFAAVVGAALAAVRIHGRWLYEWLVLSSRYLLRDRVRNLSDTLDTGVALLRLIAPEAVSVNGENGVFMISRTEGATAVLQPVRAWRLSAMTISAPHMLLPKSDELTMPFTVQIVHHVGVNRERPPRVWIALQALRTVELHGDADIRPALDNMIRRVQRQLHRNGVPSRTLAEDETIRTLASLAHVNAGRHQVQERWRLWRSGSVGQVTFRVDGLAEVPSVAGPELLPGLLRAVPETAVTVAVTAHCTPAWSKARGGATVRIATTNPARLEQSVHEFVRLAREQHLSVERLDGRHMWGLAATLPLGVVSQ